MVCEGSYLTKMAARSAAPEVLADDQLAKEIADARLKGFFEALAGSGKRVVG